MSDWIQAADGKETIREDTEAVVRRLIAENERLRATLRSVNKAIWRYRSHQVSHQESYDLFRHACDLIENAIHVNAA